MQALAVEAGRASGSVVLAEDPLQGERTLGTGFEVLDRFLGGFHRGRLTFVEAASPLVWDMALGALCQATRLGTVVAVDGGNSLDPYLVAAHARRAGLDARRVLGRLRIARAFTAHQMTALLEESLPGELLDHRPVLVLVSCLPELYLDEDVPAMEGNALVERAVERLKLHALDADAAALATHLGPAKLAGRPRMRRALHGADRVVRLLRWGQEGALLQDLAAGAELRIAPAGRGQRTLAHYDGQGRVAAPDRALPGLVPAQLMLKGEAGA